ncbi:MAG: uroporphyrinogen decarboxylase [Rhodospirillales bacterium]|nr:uroporphyrinogen decarboxylase [Rhodospirillales bacterium]MBO6787626.1 uroporphyrinogen decarboxylase [Rhodospirillales bacterium]
MTLSPEQTQAAKRQAKPFLRVLDGEIVSPPPVWMMRQAGRYLPEYREVRAGIGSFLEFCYTPDAAVEVTLQPLRRFGFDASILFADILVIPDALGQNVTFKEGEGPVLEPIRDLSGLDKLDVGGVVGNLAPIFETLRRLSVEIPKTTGLIGFAGSPWTVAVYMVEGRGRTECERARGWAYRAPAEFQKLMDILVDATSAYLIEQVKAGAEALQLFDSWAGVLSVEQFRSLVIEPTRRIVENVRKSAPDVPIIGFPRQGGIMIPEYVTETGVDGVSLDHSVPFDWAMREIPETCVLQGNLDNRLLVVGGDALDRGVDTILEQTRDRRFIFNLGHGIVPQTPPENVARVIERIRGSG